MIRCLYAAVPLLFGLGACSEAVDPAKVTLAKLLYGQTNPEAVSERGLHGWGQVLQPVTISDLGSCRFRLATPDRSEELDFHQVDEIRVSIVTDPASGLIATIGGRNQPKRDIATLVLVQIIGAEKAICTPDGCTNRRAFAMHDVTQFDAVRRAAGDFHDRLCPERSREELR